MALILNGMHFIIGLLAPKNYLCWTVCNHGLVVDHSKAYNS